MEKQINNFLEFLQKDKKLTDNTLQSYKRDINQYEEYINKKQLDYSKADETTIKNYKTAVSQINAYRQSHKMADVPTDSPIYQYVKYTQMADAEVINYQNFLISSLNFIASH